MLILFGEEVINFIKSKLPVLDENLIEIIVFGSFARGDYTPQSDIDLLLITKNIKATENVFSNLRITILMNFEIVVSAIYYTPETFKKSVEKGLPLIKTILKEGKTIWRRSAT
ncbi:MAG: nucleotidyltransferase domain-containing protein [Candidatus Odinarchaeota archaeon]